MPAKLDQKLKRAIAQRFRALRDNLGKTQKAIAPETGRDKQSYSKNERGKGASIYPISKFCSEHGVALKNFCDGEEFHYLDTKKGK